jgi:hypothetical protein
MTWGDVTCFLKFQNYFWIKKGDVEWGDFLEFLELFFNRERWHGMRWCDRLLEFEELFFNSMEKGDITSAIFLNFLNYFSIEKDGMA